MVAAAQKLAIEKKKLKVLKTALKEERAQRTTVEKELQSAMEKIEQQKQVIADKVRFIRGFDQALGNEIYEALRGEHQSLGGFSP